MCHHADIYRKDFTMSETSAEKMQRVLKAKGLSPAEIKLRISAESAQNNPGNVRYIPAPADSEIEAESERFDSIGE